ncbi:ubiquitin-like protein [Auriscalpium vulgare]|uniref:Ubiquitin-like protein n=1 Tax=Auriscalpium vulgare TaxID=40419 RepID=A0ACB8S8N1_9AGAM|nr:ubiquitin-like protein [Auriscalpium vulgare]
MSAEPEDAKPKLTITINYEGKLVTVKVKASMQFKKIFEVAEKRFQKDPGTFKFVFEGERVQPEDTPASLNMEEGDVIDAHLEQLGGATSC